MTGHDDSTTLVGLLERYARVVETFWEWRNKLLTLLLGATSALIAVSATLASKLPQHRVLAAIPCFLASLVASSIGVLDRRNAEIITACYTALIPIENKLRERVDVDRDELGLFAQLGRHVVDSRGRPATSASRSGFVRYSVVVPALSGSIAVASLVVGIYITGLS